MGKCYNHQKPLLAIDGTSSCLMDTSAIMEEQDELVAPGEDHMYQSDEICVCPNVWELGPLRRAVMVMADT